MNGMVENTENVDDDVESDDACVLGDNDLWDHIEL
jgi:hypothetical protein